MSVGVVSMVGKRDLRAGKCEKGKLVEMYNIGDKQTLFSCTPGSFFFFFFATVTNGTQSFEA